MSTTASKEKHVDDLKKISAEAATLIIQFISNHQNDSEESVILFSIMTAIVGVIYAYSPTVAIAEEIMHTAIKNFKKSKSISIK